ncbi:MAG: peptide deformylase [Lachnospiraceae bacterium]|nr:peptide deformylase [Ruminococcus sp.]MCM1273891.1 peptide deformylase [Lachnospiraceae bacterium]
MILDILQFGDPVLRERCEEVTEFDGELCGLLDDMYETMVGAQGIGLAAPQVGVLKRVVVIDTGKGKIELVNPIITAMWGKQFEPEGCLSLEGKRGVVQRPSHVRVKARNRFGKPVKYRGKNLLARAFCHEIDHLNGILFEDKVIEWVEEEEDGE